MADGAETGIGAYVVPNAAEGAGKGRKQSGKRGRKFDQVLDGARQVFLADGS